VNRHVPLRGDIAWLNLNPQAGMSNPVVARLASVSEELQPKDGSSSRLTFDDKAQGLRL